MLAKGLDIFFDKPSFFAVLTICRTAWAIYSPFTNKIIKSLLFCQGSKAKKSLKPLIAG
jgi:hypothetical protein